MQKRDLSVNEKLGRNSVLLKRRGNNLKILRKDAGMTQEDVAAALGYESGSSMISQIESGKTDMGADKLRQAAELFKVKPWVLDGDFTKEQIRIINAVFKNMILESKKFKYFDVVKDLLGVP